MRTYLLIITQHLWGFSVKSFEHFKRLLRDDPFRNLRERQESNKGFSRHRYCRMETKFLQPKIEFTNEPLRIKNESIKLPERFNFEKTTVKIIVKLV